MGSGPQWSLLFRISPNSGLGGGSKLGFLACKERMDRAETLSKDVKICYIQEYLQIRCDDALVLGKSARESLDLQMQFLACDI